MHLIHMIFIAKQGKADVEFDNFRFPNTLPDPKAQRILNSNAQVCTTLSKVRACV